jgi:stearoyl-CoA desaturase (delta-9 desaturase)
MENTTKLLMNHILCHLMLVPAFMYGEWWMFLVAFLWWYVIAIVAISGGYHRYYSHKSFNANKWYPYTVNLLGIFSGAGPVLSWVGAHRMHHAYSDTAKDPHSYKFKGFWSIYLNTWGYGLHIDRKFIRELLKDRVVRWFYKNYFKINIAIILIFTLIDPLFMIFGYALPTVFAFHGYGILNTLGHRDAQPRNTWIGNILTAGEGWHLNHHKKGWEYQIGWEWWQFDPTATFIKFIKNDKTPIHST